MSCDPITQNCVEADPEDTTSKAHCQCKDGYVNVSTNQDHLVCQPYNPCSDTHWKAKNVGNNVGKACANSKAKCLLWPHLGEQYQCACPTGQTYQGDILVLIYPGIANDPTSRGGIGEGINLGGLAG